MRSLTFTVHFADDIGPEEANTKIAQELAAAFLALLDGYEPEEARQRVRHRAQGPRGARRECRLDRRTMRMRRWPDTIDVYRCQHDGAEVQGRCLIGGRSWLNEPSRPDPDCVCPLVARYHREDAAPSDAPSASTAAGSGEERWSAR